MKPRTWKPLTVTPLTGLPSTSLPLVNWPATQMPLTSSNSLQGVSCGVAGGSSTVPRAPLPAPRRVMRLFWTVRFSR